MDDYHISTPLAHARFLWLVRKRAQLSSPLLYCPHVMQLADFIWTTIQLQLSEACSAGLQIKVPLAIFLLKRHIVHLIQAAAGAGAGGYCPYHSYIVVTGKLAKPGLSSLLFVKVLLKLGTPSLDVGPSGWLVSCFPSITGHVTPTKSSHTSPLSPLSPHSHSFLLDKQKTRVFPRRSISLRLWTTYCTIPCGQSSTNK